MPAPRYTDADRWMDREESEPNGTRSMLGVFTPAMEAPKRFLQFASTTPGILTLLSTLIVVAILAAGGAMTQSSTWRQDDLNNLITRTEPLSNAAQEVFNSLSVADSAAITAFLEAKTSGIESDEVFEKEINNASQEVIKATSGIDQIDSREMELVLKIQTLLPKYVKLVSEARSNDRLRNPVGASYLTQASTMMQQEILPAARELYSSTSRLVSNQQRHVVSPMWFPLSGLVAAVIFLVLAQFWLFAHTNRVFNRGYVAATLLMVIALVVAAASTGVTWNQGTQGVQSSMLPLERLTQQRISAQQARTGEALGLVQRNYGSQSQSQFSKKIAAIDSDLEEMRDLVNSPESVDKAREHLKEWDTTHAEMVFQLQRGNFNEAIEFAIGPNANADEILGYDHTDGDTADSSPTTSNTRASYARFDAELRGLIEESRAELQQVLVSGRSAAQATAITVLIMTILASVCTILGSRPRLQEYL